MRTQTFRQSSLPETRWWPRTTTRTSQTICFHHVLSSDSFSVGSNTCMSSLATHLPWAVSFSPCSLAPSSSSFSQTTSSFVDSVDKLRISTTEKLKFLLYSHVQDFKYWDLLIDPCTPHTSRQGHASLLWSPGSRSALLCQTSGVANLCIKVSFGIMMGYDATVTPMSSRLLLLIGIYSPTPSSFHNPQRSNPTLAIYIKCMYVYVLCLFLSCESVSYDYYSD